MRSACSRVPLSGSRISDLLLILPVLAGLAGIGAASRASEMGDGPGTVQEHPPAENHQPDEDGLAKQNQAAQPGAPSAASDSASTSSAVAGICEALATAATTNDLPVDFFIRLIWQESHFKPDAISRKGAQGIAQFMPPTARSSGLQDAFDPLEAIAKSGGLLRGLRREFGNLGLAAAAYNAGSGRVHDWLGGRRPLPQETRAYVRLVTGRGVEEWARGQTSPVELPDIGSIQCNPANTTTPDPNAVPPKPETFKPWGVEVVGGPTPAKALARYHEWLPKYATIVADREPHTVKRGVLGDSGAVVVRIGEDTRTAATKLCAELRAAGTYCEVLRN